MKSVRPHLPASGQPSPASSKEGPVAWPSSTLTSPGRQVGRSQGSFPPASPLLHMELREISAPRYLLHARAQGRDRERTHKAPCPPEAPTAPRLRGASCFRRDSHWRSVCRCRDANTEPAGPGSLLLSPSCQPHGPLLSLGDTHCPPSEQLPQPLAGPQLPACSFRSPPVLRTLRGSHCLGSSPSLFPGPGGPAKLGSS